MPRALARAKTGPVFHAPNMGFNDPQKLGMKCHERKSRSCDPRRHHCRWGRWRSVRGRCRDQGRPDQRGRQGFGQGPRRNRRARQACRAGLCRHPHALRRPGHLEPRHHAILTERRHDRGDGQLRRRLRAMPAGRPSAPDPVDGGRRGYPRTCAERRHPLVLGKLSGLHGLARQARFRHRHRRAIAARGASRLCDGRARRTPRSLHAGGQRGDGKTCARGGALRRTRLLDLAHPQSPHLDR